MNPHRHSTGKNKPNKTHHRKTSKLNFKRPLNNNINNTESSDTTKLNVNFENETDQIVSAESSASDQGMIGQRDRNTDARLAGIEEIPPPTITTEQQGPDESTYDEGASETPGSSHNQSIE